MSRELESECLSTLSSVYCLTFWRRPFGGVVSGCSPVATYPHFRACRRRRLRQPHHPPASPSPRSPKPPLPLSLRPTNPLPSLSPNRSRSLKPHLFHHTQTLTWHWKPRLNVTLFRCLWHPQKVCKLILLNHLKLMQSLMILLNRRQSPHKPPLQQRLHHQHSLVPSRNPYQLQL